MFNNTQQLGIFGRPASCKVSILATRKEAWELLGNLLFVCFANENQSVGSLLQPAAGFRVNPFSVKRFSVCSSELQIEGAVPKQREDGETEGSGDLAVPCP